MRISRLRDQRRGSPFLADVRPQDGTETRLRCAPNSNLDQGATLETLLGIGPLQEVLFDSVEEVDLTAPWIDWLPPIEDPRIIVCAGQNFATHANESVSVSTPVRPSAFLRVARTLTGHGATVPYPSNTESLDYEVEVAAVIGKPATDITSEQALDHVAGFCLANDLSARDIQFDEAKAGSMVLGKNQPSSLPLGPWLTTTDEIESVDGIEIRLEVNGNRRQSDRLESMTLPFPELTAYWSALGLGLGDLVLSGTPPGVGIFQTPPEEYLLSHGDQVVCSSPQLGELAVTIGTA